MSRHLHAERDARPVRGLGSVPRDYRHIEKEITPAEGIALPGAFLKWYDVVPADAPILPEVRDDARDFLDKEGKRGALSFEDELGFVILHRCGETFYFLLVCTWRNNNELWESIYFADEAVGPGFHPFKRPKTHIGTYCVWELGAVWHEQQAFSRYLRSPRDGAALRAYLEDQRQMTV